MTTALWVLVIPQLAVAGLLAWTTLAGRDLWPFSHYPMFAGSPTADRSQFFRLRFQSADGRWLRLSGSIAPLGEAFDRDFRNIWPATAAAGPAAEALVMRYWQESARLKPRYAEARRAEVTVRLAHIGGEGGIAVTEKVVCVVALSAEARG